MYLMARMCPIAPRCFLWAVFALLPRCFFMRLEETDLDGNPYTFSVRVGQTENGEFVPRDPYAYAVSVNKLNVTNTFIVTTDASAKAVIDWTNGSAIRTSERGTAFSLPSWLRVAVSGARPISLAMASEVRPLALASKNLPRVIRVRIMAAESK